MQVNNNLSFGAKYNFFQTQRDFICAYCGKRLVPEIEMNEIGRLLDGKRGVEVADILSPYLEIMPEGKQDNLLSLVENAKNPKFQNFNFKELSMLIKDKNIYTSNPRETLKKLLNYIHFSVEHVVARINGGKNEVTNYLPMHLGCNMDRSAYSYSALAKENSDFMTNLRNSLLVLKIKNHLKEIKLPENYFSDMKNALKTHGLDITSLSDI